MFQQAFQHRSGRVIALGRALLAAAFLIGSLLDPTDAPRHSSIGIGLLAAYLGAALLSLAATWDNWRLETRLAVPALAMDVGVFASLVFLTEGYSNPFFPMFVFIVLSAALRWSWRETAATAAALIAIFLGVSAAGVWQAGAFSPELFFFRSAFLVVLSFVLVWFGFNQARPRMARLDQGRIADPAEAGAPPVRVAAEFVATHSGARRIVFAWWSGEEPWTHVATLDAEGFDSLRHDPGAFGPLIARELAGAPFLFDVGHLRILRREGARRRMQPFGHAIDPAFADRYRLTSGLALPVDSSGYGGVLFALDMPGLCSDDITQAEGLAEEISAAFERASAMALLADAASARVRLSLSRDLHDSVLQLLAGTAFRLEGVKKSARAGRPVEPEIDSLQGELVAEQREVRALIGEWRKGSTPEATADLERSLAALAERMSRQWSVACRIEECPGGLETSVVLERDCHQLVREAVANAVRHGKASRVGIRVARRDAAVELIVADNGGGFPDSGRFDPGRGGRTPWSLSERVRALGGQLALASDASGSIITISLPIGHAS